MTALTTGANTKINEAPTLRLQRGSRIDADFGIAIMAEDGMLLNFELPSDAFAPKKTFRGGSWKDRLTAKKSAEYGRKKAQERAVASRIPNFQDFGNPNKEIILPGQRPNKRIKTSGSAQSKTTSQNDISKPGRRADGFQKGQWKSANGEVISSLFTYNRQAAQTQPEQQDGEDATAEPSNAPLQDELATFTSLGLSPTLASHLLKKLEITAPTAIQQQAIQQLCAADSDAFIQAETGSGKTLAYLLPILQRITDLSKQVKGSGEDFGRETGLLALILAPTRELSKQISAVLDNLLTCCHWIVGGIVIGGEKKKSEKARLRKGVNILVATPGRLADHLENTEVLDVSKVRWLVLDEGDRLMELGFEKDVQKIVSILNLRSKKAQMRSLAGLPERRTTALCSATLKSDVDQLKTIALKNPVSISVEDNSKAEGGDIVSKPQKFSAPAQLKQSYVIVPPKQRLVTLVAALKQSFRRKGSVMRCIVFISCADSVDFHFEALTRSGTEESNDQQSHIEDDAVDRHPSKTHAPRNSEKTSQGTTPSDIKTQELATTISSKENKVQLFRLHGSLPQSTRTGTLMAFSKCSDPAILICTDVASRGLDLPNVDLVIEYDPPFSKDDHLHRVGRTARAGKDGRAMIFLMPGCEEGYVDILKEGRPLNLTRHDANELLKKGFTSSSGVVSERDWEERATDWQLDVERWVLDNPKHQEQARRAFQSHIRAYATHIAAERNMFDIVQLHLGHLAKAFALRDKPGSIRVPGLRPSKDSHNKESNARKVQTAKDVAARINQQASGEGVDTQGRNDEYEARKKMLAKQRSLAGASEFNLG